MQSFHSCLQPSYESMWKPTAFCSPVSWFGRSSMKNLRRLNVILRMSILAKSHWCSLWSIFKWFCMAVYAFTCTLMHNSHTLVTHHMVHCTKTWPSNIKDHKGRQYTIRQVKLAGFSIWLLFFNSFWYKNVLGAILITYESWLYTHKWNTQPLAPAYIGWCESRSPYHRKVVMIVLLLKTAMPSVVIPRERSIPWWSLAGNSSTP